MTIWILCLPLAFLLFATALYITHSVSPLGKSVVLNSKVRLGIYSMVALSILLFTLPFTDLLTNLPVGGFVVFLFVAGLISVLSTEGTYLLSKQQKWNKVLAGISGIIGILFLELALVVIIAAALPPGTVH